MSEENISVLSSDSSTTLQVDNAALIEELENNDGDTVYPVTIDKAIYCSDGTRFDNKLQKYVHWSDDTSAEAPDVRIADNLGGQYTATDITNMSNSINTISNNLVDMIKYEKVNISNCNISARSDYDLYLPNIPSGYYKLCDVVGISGSGSSLVTYSYNPNTNVVYLHNWHSSALTLDILVTIWYVKQSVASELN